MKFIVFEGLDGAGKSTLIQGLKTKLEELKYRVKLSREPGGPPLSEDIRHLLLQDRQPPPTPRAELLLYAAGRAQHVEQLILPALKAGEVVLCDRFWASTVAFQCGGRGIDRQSVDWLKEYATQGLEADLMVFVDVSVDECIRRRQKREQESGIMADRFEKEERKFHEDVRNKYLELIDEDPTRWLKLDGALSPEDLVGEIFEEMSKRGWVS